MLLVIDNYDSFTYNLVQYLGELGAEIRVFRNDRITMDQIAVMQPARIVISPGPGRPEDAGVTIDVIRRFGPTTPILGVCLGHQAIGDGVRRHRVPRERRRCTARRRPSCTTAKACSQEWPARSQAGRYHSLIISSDDVPAELEVVARTRDEGIIMAVRHRVHPGSRRPVSSRVGVDRRRSPDPEEFPRVVMFTELLEKVVRHEDLTADEAAGAMREVMEGRAPRRFACGAARGPRDEGRTSSRDRRLRADDA